MNIARFEDLSLCQPILKALTEEGYQQPTPIQQAAIPEVLAGKDLLATAQTGTGKTAAFSLPMLHILHEQGKRSSRAIRALILTPTRELAQQIDVSIRNYSRHLPLHTAVVVGGVSMFSQIKALHRNPDILVATPGRLIDLFNQGYIRLDQLKIFVLDEADRMLDMGFIRDIRRIVAELPENRQTLFFSATVSPEINELASGILKDPAKVAVTPAASVSKNITQNVLFVDQMNKRALLTDVLKDKSVRRALVFTRTKHRANRITEQLMNHGIAADSIHSSKSQGARQRALSAFDRGRIKVLVATDIVARGIDVEGISHVINYELPNDPESYVHRIGRTARAGAVGIALSFCDNEEVSMLKGIEKLTKSSIAAIEDHPFHSPSVAAMHKQASAGSPSFDRSKSPSPIGDISGP
ncbi:MAG: DEAD/DEAH box helicase [Chlorobiales bacterium]|nr:DEAD/DEAH box helicase [Chlorobiales bacterium]